MTRRRAPVRGRGALALVLAALLACGAGVAAWVVHGGSPAHAGEGRPVLHVSGAYVPEPASPDVAAAYFTVRNSGGVADRLVAVRSDVSDMVMMHRTEATGMVAVPSVEIPAHGTVAFARDGLHVMIMSPKRVLRRGDRVRLTLVFARSAPIAVTAPVTAVGYRPPPGHG